MGLLILVLVGVWVLTQTDFGRDRIRLYGLNQLADRVHGRVTIGKVYGDLLTGARLIDVVIEDSTGAPFLTADTLELRYSMKALFQKHLVFEDVRVVRPVVVFDQPPGGEWNVERLFRGDTTVTRGDTIPGWGDWVRFDGVRVVNGDVTVRREWNPPESLAGDALDRAIDAALSDASRQMIVRAPGGYQAVSTFHDVYGSFPMIRFADADSATRVVDVDTLRMTALAFRPPAADVKQMSGRLVIGADSIGFQQVRVQLPASKLVIDGVYGFGGASGGDVRIQGDPIALPDVRFLRPSLPEGGGRADFTIGQNDRGTRLVARTLDLKVEDATLKGSLDAETGPDGVRVRASDLAFAELDTELVERLAEGVELPIDGVLTGHAKLAGVSDDLTLDAWSDIRERSGATSRVYAEGGVTSGHRGSIARDLRLRFDPLRLTLLRQAGASLPVGGAITGTARLDGPLAGMMDVNADLVHEDASTGRSHVLARGGVQTKGGVQARALRLQLEPLQARLVRVVSPEFPLGGTFRGRATVTGAAASWLAVDADLVHEQPGVGRSHVLAVGDVRGQGDLVARRLRLRFDPLQAALVREFAPDFRPDGTISGTALANGSLSGTLDADLDVTHQGSTGTSSVAGDARVTARNRVRSFDLDLQARPLSLATVGLYLPAAALRGSVTGPIVARGTTSSATFDADVDVADGGHIRARGTVGIGRTAAYDVVADVSGFDAVAVSARAPTTRFTGSVVARGVGTELATARGFVDAALVDSRMEGAPRVDSTRVRASFDSGLLTMERGEVSIGSARAEVEGSFGLMEGRSGELRYRVSADSLSQFRTQYRALARLDSGFVQPRPMVRAREIGKARLDSARVADENLVERVATGSPPARELPLDTAPPLRRDSIAGGLTAEGTLVGNIERFDARGTADLENVVFDGSYVGSGRVEYALTDAPSTHMSANLDARLAQVRVGGFAFDSASARVAHAGGRREGSGSLELAVFQDAGRDYQLDTEYTLSLDQQELRLRELHARFDSTLWSSARPGTVRWAGSGVELQDIEIVNARGGRIFADGRLPSEGSGDLRLDIDSVQVADFAALMQDTVITRGLLSLEGTFRGTTRAPIVSGTMALDSAARAGQALPSLRATFDYANSRLTGHAEAFDGARRLLAADGELPINLAFSGVQGPRLPDGPVSLDIQADSFPLESLPQLSPEVQNLTGRMRGQIAVRGTRADPELGGAIRIDGVAADLPTPGLNLRDGAGDVRFAGDQLFVDSLLVSSGGGPIEVSGTIALQTLTNPEFNLNVAADDALLLANELGEVEGSTRLTIGGTLDALRVIGDVEVVGGVIAVPEPQNMQRATRLDDPQLVGVYESLGVPPALRPRNRLLESTELVLSVTIARDTWLRNSVMNVEVHTPPDTDPLRVTIDHATRRYAFEGVIHADRGDYSFAGREFKLSTGSVTFLPEQSDPILQLSARHEVPRRTREALVILVGIGGTLEEPKVSLSSNVEPPVPESDLLSFLAFGRESSSLLTGEGSGVVGDALGALGVLAEQQLGGLALGAVTQAFFSNLEKEGMKAGLDVFRVRPRAVPDELNFSGYFQNLVKTIDIEAGEYLTPRLFVAANAQVSGNRVPGLRVEYITPRGFSWITTLENRFRPPVPTLDEIIATPIRVFGSFITWQKRF